MTFEEALKLVEYAQSVENGGEKTSLYYRLYPQIIEARDVVNKYNQIVKEE